MKSWCCIRGYDKVAHKHLTFPEKYLFRRWEGGRWEGEQVRIDPASW